MVGGEVDAGSNGAIEQSERCEGNSHCQRCGGVDTGSRIAIEKIEAFKNQNHYYVVAQKQENTRKHIVYIHTHLFRYIYGEGDRFRTRLKQSKGYEGSRRVIVPL